MSVVIININEHLGRSVAERLQETLTYVAGPSLHPPIERYVLRFWNVAITPTVLALFVKLLHQSLPNSDTHNGGKESKWALITFECCRFRQPPLRPGGAATATHESIERPCTPNELQTLYSALVQRTRCLSIDGSPEILAGFLTSPELDPRDLESLYIGQGEEISSVAYERLTEIIQGSPQMKKLGLHLPFREAPLAIYDTLANLINLQRLTFGGDALSNLVAGERVVPRLLLNPQSQLQQLHLRAMALGDRDFVEIVRLLPQTQIEVLNVACNDIHVESIVEFARQIPNLRTLKKARLRPNPWTEPDATSLVTLEECGTALVEGMMANYSVEYLDILEAYSVEYVDNLEDEDADPPPETWLRGSMKTLECSPEMTLLMHYATLNQAERRLLISSSPVPLGLWPLVLERAGTTLEYPFFDNDSEKQQQFKATAVYYLLRQSPMIFENSGRSLKEATGMPQLLGMVGSASR